MQARPGPGMHGEGHGGGRHSTPMYTPIRHPEQRTEGEYYLFEMAYEKDQFKSVSLMHTRCSVMLCISICFQLSQRICCSAILSTGAWHYWPIYTSSVVKSL